MQIHSGTMKTLKRLLSYTRPYLRQMIAGFMAMVVVVVTAPALADLLRMLTDRVVGEGNYALLNKIAAAAVLITLVKEIFTFVQRYLFAFVGQKVVAELRQKTFEHLHRLSIAFHETHRLGESVSRISYDIGLIQVAVSTSLANLVYNAMFLLGIFAVLMYTQWRLTVIILAIVPPMFWLVSRMGARIRKFSRIQQEKTANLTSVLQESLSAIRVVKAFNMEELGARRFARENQANFDSSMKSAQTSATMLPAIELLLAVVMALIVWYGISEILRGHLTAGQLISYFALIALAGAPITSLSQGFSNVQTALAAGERVFGLLDQDITIKDDPHAMEPPRLEGRVEFQDVTFSYRDGLPVLSHINLDVRPGEIVAFVGPSGAGKTSLVNLIPRFYDPVDGRVLVDGFDVRHVRIASLRRQIGLVPQETILFGVSVRENIGYGRPGASLEEIIQSARAANAHEFIQALPEGYETMLGERGASLSGGQRQRVAIARALLRDPRILILDEATSSLDAESERLVQEALERLMQGRTTFVIAHRLSTIKFAQKIVVLDNGRFIEQGTHDQLMAEGGLYRRLYERQFQTDTEEKAE